jgi:MoxR-like ATPase
MMATGSPAQTRQTVADLERRIDSDIIGQERVVRRIIIALLANGNVLLEGLPGLVKTRAVKSLAKNLDAEYRRIQFTPDLLPSDVKGAKFYAATASSSSEKDLFSAA